MSTSDAALKLKAEGNALFVKGDWAGAHGKYTLAIAQDEKNAVIYANRAQCSLNLKRYLDAATDAEKATDIDSMYAKAWARRATAERALNRLDRSINHWKRALGVLPKENLTSLEQLQRTQYETALKETERELRKKATAPITAIPTEKNQAPWKMVERILPELVAAGPSMLNSSAWVIRAAFLDWSEGLGIMKTMREIPTPDGGVEIIVQSGALACFSNAILRDERVFHLTGTEWIEKYHKMVGAEANSVGAYDKGGPELIIADVQKRLSEKGWTDVRMALSVTIRGWMMRGFMESTVTGSHGAGLEFLSRALEILDLGRTKWNSVPESDKGIIFSKTFSRGVRCLYMQMFSRAFLQNPSLNSDYALEDLLDIAEEIIRDVDEDEPDHSIGDSGFISSFFTYPKAEALSIKGLYHYQSALLNADSEPNDHYSQASEYYLDAADLFPEDEEKRNTYLYYALECLWKRGTPLKITLPIIDKIEKSIPKVARIWALLGEARKVRDARLQLAVSFGKEVRQQIRQGLLSLESMTSPQIEE